MLAEWRISKYQLVRGDYNFWAYKSQTPVDKWLEHCSLGMHTGKVSDARRSTFAAYRNIPVLVIV